MKNILIASIICLSTFANAQLVKFGDIDVNTFMATGGVSLVLSSTAGEMSCQFGPSNLTIITRSGYITNALFCGQATNWGIRMPGLAWSSGLMPPGGVFRAATSNECDVFGFAYDAGVYVSETNEVDLLDYVINLADGMLWRGNRKWAITNSTDRGFEVVGDGEYTRGTMAFSRWVPTATTNSLTTRSDIEAYGNVISGIVHDLATSLIGAPYVLQGARVVPLDVYSSEFSGRAESGPGGTVRLIPRITERPTEANSTGTIYIATSPDRYIVDVSADIYVSRTAWNSMEDPVKWKSYRASPTNWVITAWCPGNPTAQPYGNDGWFATLSNLVVSTYDRPGYQPNTLTNDNAGIPLYADSPDISSADRRRVATAGSVRDNIDARKFEIANYAWRTTPSGGLSPDAGIVTIDKPLVQQGSIAYMQSGDYFVFSYNGGDWRQTDKGSLWALGFSGREDFVLKSESRMAHIFSFDVSEGVATIYASTNWMASASSTGLPRDADVWVEREYDLANPQWLACPSCTAMYHVDAINGDYWVFTAPATAEKTFYRIMIGGGETRIISRQPHRFENGIELGTNGVIYVSPIIITNGTQHIEVMGRYL